MDAFSTSLAVTILSVAFLHTLLGPDHWLPFVALGRARGWSLRRTLLVTAGCGLAHVASSIGLAALALALGWGATEVAGIESVRGDLAAWLLIGFGAAYALWGLRRALRARRGVHRHGGLFHSHHHGELPHSHGGDEPTPATRSGAVWALLIIFVLGPCEPMIPLLVAPAGRGDWGTAAVSALLFSVVTVVTMLVLVAVGSLGIERLPLRPLERWSHAIAGTAVGLCGVAIVALGW